MSSDLPDDQRTDRVIATAWDTAYVLYDGIPDAEEIERICHAAPKQEAARFTERDLVLSRANKSVRLFGHVVERLRTGRQPDVDLVRRTGYLMRTTAVYGNGKFGIADRAVIEARAGLGGPFMAEMLTVWLIRLFTHDLVEFLGGAPLDRGIKRHLGIGNSTGLGMAPFLVTHPVLVNNWMTARETALARVRAQTHLTQAQVQRLCDLAARAARHLDEWEVPDAAHQARIVALRKDWRAAGGRMTPQALQAPQALDRLVVWSEGQSLDVQELLVSLLLEPFGDLVDGLAECMCDPYGALVTPFADTHALRTAIETCCAWALAPDYACPTGSRQFWYVSAAKQEPRLGDRYAEAGAELESPLDIGRRIKALHAALPAQGAPLAAFLAEQPDHALAAWRVAVAQRYP